MTGKAPIDYEPHIRYLLNEVPVSMVVVAIEETAEHEHRPPTEIWKNLSRLAATHGGSRKEMWK